jgi:hypothetical protein
MEGSRLQTLWCAAASWLGSSKKIITLVERPGRWLVPVVLMITDVTTGAESFFLPNIDL